jgi:hypothetical protein
MAKKLGFGFFTAQAQDRLHSPLLYVGFSSFEQTCSELIGDPVSGIAPGGGAFGPISFSTQERDL